MSNSFDKLDPNLKRQYVGAYGEYYSGDYQIGDQIPGEGEVLWSFLSAAHGVIYVVSGNGFPAEVAANEIRQSK